MAAIGCASYVVRSCGLASYSTVRSPNNSKFATVSFTRSFNRGIRSAASIVDSSPSSADAGLDNGNIDRRISLACPVCHKKLTVSDAVTFAECSSRTKLKCQGCKKSYSGKENHLDLTISSGDAKFGDSMPLATEIFRNPIVSFAYERGWRQNFVIGGFPGPEKEFEMMGEYLRPVSGGNIVDASCGSGLFSRIFAKSGMFSLVVALDFSESMLQQCSEYIKEDNNITKQNVMLVRSDIARLPFSSASIDAVHAGAAIHCWSAPVSAVAEICRVLKPGGVFVGTTYVMDGRLRLIPLLNPIRQGFTQISGSQIFLDERELEDICSACGMVDYKFKRNGQFIMFSAKKQS